MCIYCCRGQIRTHAVSQKDRLLHCFCVRVWLCETGIRCVQCYGKTEVVRGRTTSSHGKSKRSVRRRRKMRKEKDRSFTIIMLSKVDRHSSPTMQQTWQAWFPVHWQSSRRLARHTDPEHNPFTHELRPLLHIPWRFIESGHTPLEPLWVAVKEATVWWACSWKHEPLQLTSSAQNKPLCFSYLWTQN